MDEERAALVQVSTALHAMVDSYTQYDHPNDSNTHDWWCPDWISCCHACGARSGTARGFAPCPVPHAAALFGRHRKEVGFVRRASIQKAQNDQSLYVRDQGAAYVWVRRDGITTLHAIVSEQPGTGQQLLGAIEADARTRGHRLLRAKCPADLPANDWYRRRGFGLIAVEVKPGRKDIHVWQKAL